jgi:hypothetical protein
MYPRPAKIKNMDAEKITVNVRITAMKQKVWDY